MRQEQVETVRRAIDALDRGDLPGVMEEMAEDFSFDFSRSRSPERGVYGREEIPRLLDSFTGVWESMRWEAGELIEAGPGELIAMVTSNNRGRDGIELQAKAAWLWSFRDNGRITRITFFQDRDEALEAAGLVD